MQPCDNRSVGILVFKGDRILLIDRKRPPYGLAAPAGHVDDHGDKASSEEDQFLAAAIAELKEETGLVATALELVAEGRKENHCRRGGTWHYWRIYKAETTGELDLSAEETRGHLWCDKEQMQYLLKGGSMDIQGRQTPLEEVWKEWFQELDRLGSLF
jgi:8-oxo-dGTP pyrophosphatase MutT (NUDIX family)